MSGIDARTDPEALLAHGDFVRAVARSLLWDEHAAEDVVQQTWLAALGAPAGAHRGWLAAVARNLAVKRIRGDRRRAARETAAARPEATPSDADVLARERLRRVVVDEVLALPEPYRATILLRHFEGLPPRDVARRMDVPVETVRTRTRRALEMLRVRLDARQKDDRDAFCAALFLWAEPRPSVGSATTTSVGAGGALMGTKTVVAGAVVVLGLAAWLLWPRPAAAPSGGETAKAARPAATSTPNVGRPRSSGVAGESADDGSSAPKPTTAAVVEPAPPPKPTATIVVTAVDKATNAPVTGFFAEFGCKDRTPVSAVTDQDNVHVELQLADAAGETIVVVAAKGPATGRREVAARAGERVEVRVEIERGGEVRGRVVDATGKPVADALVFFGEEDVARGDEPFKPFDERRVRAGVRSDSDGRFALTGEGRWITAWRADGGPVTVYRGFAGHVVLPARGKIVGVLHGAGGAPEAGRDVFLDRVKKTTTDGAGRFEFADVEPGTRGLSLTGGKPKAYVAVRVAAGATSDVEMKPGLPSVRIEWPGRANLGRFVGLVPLDPVGSMAIGEPDGAFAVAKDVTPCKYVLMGEGGALAFVDVAGPEAKAVVGTGEIVVRAKAKTRVFIVPEGVGYLGRLLGGRMAGAGVPADGVQRFGGLAAGRYEVGVERDGVRAVVTVKDGAVVETSID